MNEKDNKNFEGLEELVEQFNIPLIDAEELRLVEVEGVAYLLDKNDNCRYMMPMEDYLALLEWKKNKPLEADDRSGSTNKEKSK